MIHRLACALFVPLATACSVPLAAPGSSSALDHAFAVAVGQVTVQLEVCNNDIDDDGDGFVDRADPDCARSSTGKYKSGTGVELGFIGEAQDGHDWMPKWPDVDRHEVEFEMDGESYVAVHSFDSRSKLGQIELLLEGDKQVASIVLETTSMVSRFEVAYDSELKRDSVVLGVSDGSWHLAHGPLTGDIIASDVDPDREPVK